MEPPFQIRAVIPLRGIREEPLLRSDLLLCHLARLPKLIDRSL
jgi:hypothetical protein